MSWEYLIHLEIPNCSFKIPFPSFKSGNGVLQLSHGHCQTNLRQVRCTAEPGCCKRLGFLEGKR